MDRSSSSFGGESVNLGSSCPSKGLTVYGVIVLAVRIRIFLIIGSKVSSSGSSDTNNRNDVGIGRR